MKLSRDKNNDLNTVYINSKDSLFSFSIFNFTHQLSTNLINLEYFQGITF